jgi:hypothetical protein
MDPRRDLSFLLSEHTSSVSESTRIPNPNKIVIPTGAKGSAVLHDRPGNLVEEATGFEARTADR